MPRRLNDNQLRSLMLLLASIIIVPSWWFYYQSGMVVAYNDSIAKITNARRMFDNPMGRFSVPQIGSVWPPLQSMFSALTAWFDWMYYTALAGSIWSMVFYVLSTGIMFALVMTVTHNRFAACVAVAALALNLNFVYFSTTPMTETLVVTGTLLCTYGLVLFEKNQDWWHASIAGGLLGISCLIRYEFWFFLVCLVPVLWLMLRRLGHTKIDSVYLILPVYVPALVVMLAWLGIWQFQVMGHPFYFAVSRYSAKAIDVEPFNYAFIGNMPESLRVYYSAVNMNIHIVLLFFAALGLGLYVLRTLRRKEVLTPLYLFATPAFFVFSLFMGQNAIDVRTVSFFNLRYGLTILPLIAFGIGYLIAMIMGNTEKISKVRTVSVLIPFALIVMLQILPWKSPLEIAVLQDISANHKPYRDALAVWVGDHYDGGNILIESFGQNTGVQYNSGIPLREYISEVNPTLWDLAMLDPENQVSWVITRRGDQLDQTLTHTAQFKEDFQIVFENEYGYVYKARI